MKTTLVIYMLISGFDMQTKPVAEFPTYHECHTAMTAMQKDNGHHGHHGHHKHGGTMVACVGSDNLILEPTLKEKLRAARQPATEITND